MHKNIKLLLTGDHSHTLYLPDLNESYHSRHGAVAESRHIFIENGLKSDSKQNLRILEVGFGTGLNAFMTFLENKKIKKNITYVTLEPHPLEISRIQQLNYTELLKAGPYKGIFEQMHMVPFQQKINLDDQFSFKKLKATVQEVEISQTADLIYYDAFAPHAQPELWTKNIFIKLRSLMAEKGVLVTYCAKGSVKRDLASSGFSVETLPGPPGKREMIKAVA